MIAIALDESGPVQGAGHMRGDIHYEDPLDADEATDLPVSTTRRAITRIALVATEAGARFQREEVAHDPMAWMLAPRRLFGGASAIDACLDRDECLKGLLLHGLSLGLDAEPAVIEALLCDDASSPGQPWAGGEGAREEGAGPRRRRLRLYTAMAVIARGGELLYLFHASVAPSTAVVRERIRSRFGGAAAEHAEIRVGVDVASPLVMGMIPPAVMETLVPSRRGVRWSEMPGLDVTVEQRVPS